VKCFVPASIVLTFSLFCCDLLASGAPQRAEVSAASDASAMSAENRTPAQSAQVIIAGPRRSFLRMAGISQQITPEEVLPLLSRNVFTQGYQGASETEFLILLRRYVQQSRELASLAAKTGMVLRVSNCSEAAPLLRILGYRARLNCGTPDTSLLTDDPERAFLTIDSGFPLPALEQALRGGKPFEYPYNSEAVPTLFNEADWTRLVEKKSRQSNDLLDAILGDRSIARLYWAFSRLDPETAKFLEQSVGLTNLLPYAAVLDFYGRELSISNGSVIVPGGTQAAGAWKELVGAGPDSPASFVRKLLAKDKGWLAAYFDVLSRASAKQQEYFTESHRLRLFYSGLRAPDPSSPATRGSFRPAPWLLLLATRLQLDDSGKPMVPGGLEEWKHILLEGPEAKVLHKWARQNVRHVDDPDQLIKIMFALSRSLQETTPLKVYLAVSELDARRSPKHRLAPATAGLLARNFEDFSAQYRTFVEFPELNDQSIALFMRVAHGLQTFPMADRGNAFGIFQANVGIWQILVRQRQIPRRQVNESWQQMIQPFATIRSSPQLYDAGRSSLAELFRFSTGTATVSQDKIIELLAGPVQATPEGREMHRDSAARIRSVLNDQRLVSLDTLMTVGNALKEKEGGKQPEAGVILLADQTREFQMPRPIFSLGEREEWAAGVYYNRHTDVQMKTDVVKVLKSIDASHKQIEEARGRLASFLRDALVGLNYAYYEPPNAQALHYNPLLVRSHDFVGESVVGVKDLWQEPQIFGQGSPAGGGAHFVGSLAGLPYALARLEQDFISPHNVQALIWNEVAPTLLADAILPRWWNVSRTELHAVALYQRAGEELLTASVNDEGLRAQVLGLLSARLLPRQSRELEQNMRAGRATEILTQTTPADSFYLAVAFREKYPEQFSERGGAPQELQELSRQHPDEVNWRRLAHDFGIPHPTIAQNYGPELLNMVPMPPFSGDASEFLAESWDSPNLYWARLADELGYSPVMLNQLAPQLTEMMIEKIFATDFEDWPALLRAMHEAGKDFRQVKAASSRGVDERSSLSNVESMH
jgi:hypothetical protein